MSFIFEFRAKHFGPEQEIELDAVQGVVESASSGATIVGERFAYYETILSERVEDVRTFWNCRAGMQIMMIAMMIGVVMNSGALVNRSQDLPEGVVGDQLINWSENWHGLMERSQMALVLGGIRDAVQTARRQQWSDIGLSFGAHQDAQLVDEVRSAALGD